MPVNALTNSFVLGATTGGVEWGTTIVTIITFIILLALLKNLLGVHLKVMDKRERDINRDIDEAEEAKLNAQKLEEENKRHLKKHKMKFIIFLKMQEFKHVNNMKKLLKMHMNVQTV